MSSREYLRCYIEWRGGTDHCKVLGYLRGVFSGMHRGMILLKRLFLHGVLFKCHLCCMHDVILVLVVVGGALFLHQPCQGEVTELQTLAAVQNYL